MKEGECAPNSTPETVSTSHGQCRWLEPDVSILVVEDEPALRRLFKEALGGQGYAVTVVANGQSAIDVIAAHPVHILFMDLKLPDMDGMTVLEHALKQNPRTVGIVMTGHGSIELATKAMKAGASEFLTKPFDMEEIVGAVRRILEAQRPDHGNGVLKQSVLKIAGVRLQSFQPEALELRPLSTRVATSGGPEPIESYELIMAEAERRAREYEATLREREHALLAGVIQELQAACRAALARAEEQVASLAFEIARKVVKECADEKRDLILICAKAALDRVHEYGREHGLVQIRIHPKDLSVLESAREALAGAFEGPLNIRIDTDPSISPGGCRVETATRLVEATLEAQLISLGGALKHHARE